MSSRPSASIETTPNTPVVFQRGLPECTSPLLRAGLAGLYSTLYSLKDEKKPKTLSWELTQDSIQITSKGEFSKDFQWIINHGYQTKEGIFYCPGIHRSKTIHKDRMHFHNAMMGTFLQHGRIQVRTKGGGTAVSIEDECKLLYFPLLVEEKKIKYRKDAESILFAEKRGSTWSFENLVELSGYVMPGAPPRFTHETSWIGTIADAFLLFFAPLSCSFAEIEPSRGTWCILIPELEDLETFERFRRDYEVNTINMFAGGPGDAALRYLTEMDLTGNKKDFSPNGCEVYVIGKVAWNKKQQVRRLMMRIHPTEKNFRIYKKMRGIFQNKIHLKKTDASSKSKKSSTRSTDKNKTQKKKDENYHWVSSPYAAARIAENLVQGKRWYYQFAKPLSWYIDTLERKRKSSPGSSHEKIWFESIRRFERAELIKFMENNEIWNSEEEQWFVKSFHETLSRLYAKEASHLNRRGGSRTLGDRWKHMNEKIYRDLAQAKTSPQIRTVISDLWAKSGRPPSLQEHTGALWKFISKDSEYARDLSLVALASYQGSSSLFRETVKDAVQKDEGRQLSLNLEKATTQEQVLKAYQTLWDFIETNDEQEKNDLEVFVTKNWKRALEIGQEEIQKAKKKSNDA
ncbi:type I-MYXAN CRISPR-associated Cas8a1/Cmx1 [Leptospira interrogans]|uniref:type I-MYXAN CRISPR-associated Cas8a1/Cmx1 n=1 Tax=Leptospira interrogans TaxID=173 RepID=UPI0007749FCE|nr:type I-MYXAN CRISPR-associated Cas8a1/Cmx1 [Leptospira interrogans]